MELLKTRIMKINDLKIGTRLTIILMSATIVIVCALATYAYFKNKSRVRNYSDELVQGTLNGLNPCLIRGGNGNLSETLDMRGAMAMINGVTDMVIRETAKNIWKNSVLIIPS